MKIPVRIIRKTLWYLLEELPESDCYINVNGFVCNWFIDNLKNIYPMTSTVAERNEIIDELNAISKSMSEQ